MRPDDMIQMMLEYVSVAGRMNGALRWLPPDSKMQATNKYIQRVIWTSSCTNGDLRWVPPDGMTQVLNEHVTDAYGGDLWWVRPDDKTQVTFEYVQRADLPVVRKNGDLWWLRPDDMTQVTFEYVQRANLPVVRMIGDLWWVWPVGKTQVLRKMMASLDGRPSSTCTVVGMRTGGTDCQL